MKAIQIDSYTSDLQGAIQNLTVVDKAIPKPGPGQVLVKIEAAPCNPSDLLFLCGAYGVSKSLPAVPGWEGAGIVVESGGGLIGRWLKGKRVACGGQSDNDGTWAEYYVADVNHCIPLSNGVSSEQGATLIINPLTAIGMVQLAERIGAKALVQSAACSQVGRMVQVLARRKKLPLINIVRREEQVQQLESTGEKWVLNSSNEDFLQRLRKTAEKLQATIAFEAVAGSLTGQILGAMPDGSRAVVYGALSAAACSEISPMDLIFKNKSVEGFWLTQWMRECGFWGTFKATRLVQELMSSGEFHTTIARRASFDEWKDALMSYQETMTTGKAILSP